MKFARVVKTTLLEAAFVAAALGLAAGSVVLFSVAAPRQTVELCMSARALVLPRGLSWSCGGADPLGGAPPAQVIVGR